MRMHMLFLMTFAIMLHSVNAQAMQEHTVFFLHNNTQEHAHFFEGTPQTDIRIVTVAPKEIRCMTLSVLYRKVGLGLSYLNEFKTVNPQGFLFCQWNGTLPVKEYLPTREALVLIKLLEQNNNIHYINAIKGTL